MSRLDPANLAEAFDIHLARNPDGAALIVGDATYSRRELAELASRATGLLLRHGVGQGARVVVQYETSPEEVALALAVARLGGTFIPIPKRLGIREINYLLDRSQASMFCHTGATPAEGLVAPAGAAVVASAAVRQHEAVAAPIADVPDDHCALIGVTSGSTGQPKGVMHGWTAVAWAGERMRALGQVQPDEKVLMTGAGAGAPGFTFFTYMPLASGATIVRATKWDPTEVLRLAKQHDCVWSCMVPTILRMLLDARPGAIGDARLDAMRSISMGGAYMSEDLICRAREELGVEVLRMFAMAECMSNASTQLTDDVAVRNLLDGKAGPDAALCIFDDERRPLPAGTRGEIGLKGPSLLQGYLGEPNGKSDLMTPDGFFLSGDIGEMDEAGYIRVVGRKKDMINRGGYKIDPSEVEEVIGKHPAVAKVAVVGYPDALYGERSCAVVELRDGATLDFDDLKTFLAGEGLSKEKFPERLECRDALPLTSDGKIRKAELKAQIESEIAST